MDDKKTMCLEQEAEQTGTASTTKWAMDKFQICPRNRNIQCNWLMWKSRNWVISHINSTANRKKTKNSRTSRPSTLKGAPLMDCNITVNIAYNTPRQ